MNVLVVEEDRTDFVLIKCAIEKLTDTYQVIHAGDAGRLSRPWQK